MNYIVMRIATNAEGGSVATTTVFPDRPSAEANFHTQLADCATKVRSGRLCDGCILALQNGVVLKNEFYPQWGEENA